MNYLYSVATLVLIYCILSSSLNLVLGYGGMFNMGHGGFFAIGAYTAALVAVNLGLPFPVELLLAGLISAASGVVIGLPSIRLKGDYIAFCTFAFGMVVYSVVNNWVEVTRGPNGIVGITAPSVFGLRFQSYGAYFLLTLVVAAASVFLMRRLIRSPYGMSIEALREDETAAISCGRNVAALRVQVFCAGAFFAGIAGCLFVHYMKIADPTNFQTATSFLLVSMVIIGGMGSLLGPIAGALLVTVIPELLKLAGIPGFYAVQLQNIVYSLLLVVIILRRPQGMFGKLKF